jgi:hypothetical protein
MEYRVGLCLCESEFCGIWFNYFETKELVGDPNELCENGNGVQKELHEG